MVRNFGYRWEGRTYWYDPDNADNGKKKKNVKENELQSIYQLEFPENGRKGVGTWKGWNILQDGDTRSVPLSRETCIDRTKGSSTFQFVTPSKDGDGVGGVGGRCPVSFPSTTVAKVKVIDEHDENKEDRSSVTTELPFPQQLFLEINFFHGIYRRGVVVTYDKLEEEKGEQRLCYYRRNPRIMVMNFRRASNGYRDDDTMEPESIAISSTIDDKDVAAPAAQDADTRTFLSSLTLKRSFDILRKDYLEQETTKDTTKESIFSNIQNQKEEGYVFTSYPEGLFLCLPDAIPLHDDEDCDTDEDTSFELQFGCDFQRDGGPVKLVCVKYGKDKQLKGWSLHEFGKE